MFSPKVKYVEISYSDHKKETRGWYRGEISLNDFLAKCKEFYLSRGTRLNDYEEMIVRMPIEGER